MKVILTNKKEKANIKQITDLLNLILFDYNIVIEEKNKTSTRKAVRSSKKTIRKSQKEDNKTIIKKSKKVIIRDTEKIKKQKEWLEDYYYSQSHDKEEIDRLVKYYSNRKRILNCY